MGAKFFKYERVKFNVVNMPRNSNKKSKTSKKLLIFAHHDLDGVASCSLIHSLYRHYFQVIDCVFLGPNQANKLQYFLIEKNFVKKYDNFVFVDLAVDNKNIYNTINLIMSIKDKISFIVDHHVGWGKVADVVNKINKERKLEIIKDAKVKNCYDFITECDFAPVILSNPNITSCSEYIWSIFDFKGSNRCKEIMTLGSLADDFQLRRECKENNYSLYKLVKSYKYQNSIKTLLRFINPKEDLKRISKKGSQKFYNIYNQTKSVGNTFKKYEKNDKIGYTNYFPDVKIDLTTLCEIGYEDFEIVVVKEVNTNKCQVAYTIASRNKEVDLLKTFNLDSGNTQRITIVNDSSLSLGKILKCLDNALNQVV